MSNRSRRMELAVAIPPAPRPIIVCVIEESQHKFLAVGRSCVSSKEMESLTKGEIVKNMHYISDKFWEAGKSITD